LAPGAPRAGAVAVPLGIVTARRWDAVPRQPLGDRIQPKAAVHVFVEDPLHDRCGYGIDGELVQPLAVGGRAPVRMRASVDEQISIGRPPTEETALAGCLILHG